MRVKAIVMGSALAFAVGAVGIGPALASSSEGAPEVTLAQEDSAKKDTSRRVCKMIMPSGTRLGIRTCKSKDEWDRLANQARRDAEQQRLNHERVQPGSSMSRF
jgi:hypothetical protein